MGPVRTVTCHSESGTMSSKDSEKCEPESHSHARLRCGTVQGYDPDGKFRACRKQQHSPHDCLIWAIWRFLDGIPSLELSCDFSGDSSVGQELEPRPRPSET